MILSRCYYLVSEFFMLHIYNFLYSTKLYFCFQLCLVNKLLLTKSRGTLTLGLEFQLLIARAVDDGRLKHRQLSMFGQLLDLLLLPILHNNNFFESYLLQLILRIWSSSNFITILILYVLCTGYCMYVRERSRK